ncbi:6974_t:CDS:2 [Diversispora eburnea]|uniref:6974_t:CDS:1 n=1 Tax=Diversispora eburnea TaxID=1213867 RepID=A0A9N8V7P4_9GLOM|nr:6974_t:CDS:2 [Diversispora eburnea]
MSQNAGQQLIPVRAGESELNVQSRGSHIKRAIPLTPPQDIFSTPPRKIRTPDYDRLLPQRSPNPVHDLQMQIATEESSKKRKISVIEEEAQQEEEGRLYRAVVGQAMMPLRETTDDIIRRLNSTPTKSPKRLLSFSTPTKQHNNFFDSPVKNSYNSSPLPLEAQMILTSPRKSPRYISRSPYKVLDAPDLQAIDWSSTNVLGVGLGTCVYLWNAVTAKVVKLCDMSGGHSNTDNSENVTSISWMPTGSQIAVGTTQGPVEIWDVHKNERVRTMKGHTQRVGALAVNSHNVHTFSSGSRDRFIYHRDIRDPNDHFMKLTGHKQEVCGLKWNPEGTQLASGGNDNKLFIWDRTNDVFLHKFPHHTAAVKAISWSPHTHGLLASGGGSHDKKIRFWNTTTGDVCNLAWSRHANELVSTHGYSQYQIILWQYPSMEQLAVLKGHTLRVLYLSVSPDGENIVTGAGDETLRFWNVFNNGKKEKKRMTVFDIRSQIR